MWPLGARWQAGVVPVAQADLQVGDIVAFVGDRPGLVLLHRVVAIAPGPPMTLQTRGDTRTVPDPWLPASAVLGRVHVLRQGRLVVPVPVTGLPGRVVRKLGLGWSVVAPALRHGLRAVRRPRR
jgi:hypothetical protein